MINDALRQKSGSGLLSSDEGLRKAKCQSTLCEGTKDIYIDKHMLMLGIVSISIDASFYIFFFAWSSYIKAFEPQIQLDLVFAILILCYMFGSSLCPLLTWPTLKTATTMTNKDIAVPENVVLHTFLHWCSQHVPRNISSAIYPIGNVWFHGIFMLLWVAASISFHL